MSRRIRIPRIIDVVRLDQPASIAAASEDEHFDRNFEGAGPLINRWIMRRVRRSLNVDGVPLPSVAPRRFPGREKNQSQLETELTNRLMAAKGVSDAHLDYLARYVRGEGDEKRLGQTVQEAIGQLFVETYEGTERTWRAAVTLDEAPRTRNPFKLLLWAVTGAVGSAQKLLSNAVGGSLAGVHATGVAVHSVVRSLQATRALWLEPGTRDRMSDEVAVTRSLRAPDTVLRNCSAAATTEVGQIWSGTLTVFELEKARKRDPGPKTVFMAASWAHCPARDWVAALLLKVWQRAKTAEERDDEVD